MDIKQYIFVNSGFFGILTTMQVLVLKKNQGILNIYFGVLLALLTQSQFISAIDFEITEKIHLKDFFTTLAMLTVFPVLYLYFLQLTNDITKSKLTYGKTALGLVILYILLNLVLIQNNYNHTGNTIYKILIDLLYTGSFTYLNFKLLNKHFWHQRTNIRYNIFAKKWSIFMILLFFLAPLKYSLQIINYIFELSPILDDKFQPVTSISLLGLCLCILLQPNKFYNLGLHNDQYESSKIDKKFRLIWSNKIDEAIVNKADIEVYNRISKKIKYYIEKINLLDFENHILLKQNSKMNDMAIKLQIPYSHLVFLFKYNCEISFIDYKKMVRIEKAKKLIENNFLATNTLNSLGISVGFKSYDPFYKSFKEITGFGPLEYSAYRNSISG